MTTCLVGTEGFERNAVSPGGHTGLGNTGPAGAAKSGAVPSGTDSQGAASEDPRLARVVEAWPRLSEQVKVRVLALVEKGGA
jgi:hypothetical protein